MDNNKLFERLQKANPKIDLKIGDDKVFDYKRISFGVPKLDKLVGGGIPKKRFSMLYGATNVGKSFLASQLVANVQKEGGSAVWIDTEQSFDPKWNSKNGVDTSKIIVLQPAKRNTKIVMTKINHSTLFSFFMV